MAQTNGGLWKASTAILGLLLTATLVVAAANQDWGMQAKAVQTLETTVEKHTTQIECHDREIATLKANLANLLDRQRESNEKLDELLKRMPPVGRSASEESRRLTDGAT